MSRIGKLVGGLAKFAMTSFIAVSILVGLSNLWNRLFPKKQKQSTLDRRPGESEEMHKDRIAVEMNIYYREHGVFCNNCKMNVPRDDFCANCGESLEEAILIKDQQDHQNLLAY